MRMLSSSAMIELSYQWKGDSRLFHLINLEGRSYGVCSSDSQPRRLTVPTSQKTVVVTGASQGIGAAIANLFLDRGYNVVANSRNISRKTELQRSENLALVDGDIAL